MLIVGVLCVAAALVSLALGVRTLLRPRSGDPEQLVLRAIAPAQLAVGVILGAGGAIAIAGPPAVALLAVIICVTGALGILAAGSWQGARYAARLQDEQAAAPGGCGGECGCAGGAADPEPAQLPDAVLSKIMAGSITMDTKPSTSAPAAGGCGDGCGCAGGGAPAPAPEPGGCGTGCGCS